MADNCLSQDEFFRLQNQLLELRNRNYELENELKRKADPVLTSRNLQNEALQFANKFMQRGKDKNAEVELDNMRRKMQSQEEEFRLQQETWLTELREMTSRNTELLKQIDEMSSTPSLYGSPEGVTPTDAPRQLLPCANSKQLVDAESETDPVEFDDGKLEELTTKYKLELDNAQEYITNVERERKRETSALQQELVTLQQSSQEMNEKLSVLDSENRQLRDVLSTHESTMLSKNAEAAEQQKIIEELRQKLKELSLHSAMIDDQQQKAIDQELSQQKSQFEAERSELQAKIISLEDKLTKKDTEKTAALKKQSALLRELQKAAREEKRRADTAEREKTSAATGGWHVIEGDRLSRSSHTMDGNESVTSLSALESDNVELISRLAILQKTHAETLDRMHVLESENGKMRKEIREKGELIESWIRSRPTNAAVAAPSSQLSPTMQKADGFGLMRKFISSTLGNEDQAHDIMEMNKKLQRLLEETLSKNIILQRDLQTLIERTEM